MTSITVSLPEDPLTRPNEIADRLGVVPEELVRVSVEELLARPGEEFERAMEYVFTKNSDLCRRLA